MTDVLVKVIKRIVNPIPPKPTGVVKVIARGPRGPKGEDGATLVGEGAHIYQGSGVPDSALGADNEWYIDSDTADMYQKQDGTWEYILTILGPQGPAGPAGEDGQLLVGEGANILTGDGVPSDSIGTDADLYLDNVGDDIYKKVSGHWEFQTNIRGSAGPEGIQGLQGNPGSNGTNGWTPVFAVVVDGSRNVLQVVDWTGGSGTKPVTGKYVGATGLVTLIADAVNIRGAQGAAGAAGADGADGADGPAGADGADGVGNAWRSGSGAPSDSLGINGDLYLDTVTDDVYQKAAGTYSIVANIKGSDGAAGADGADGADGAPGSAGTTQIVVEIDGNGNVITTGLKGFLPLKFAGTITSATLVADRAGAIVVDIWKCTYAQFDAGATHPVTGDKITSSTPPTITASNTKAQDTTLASWTTTFADGDLYGFNVNSCTTIQKAWLILAITRS